MAPKRPLEIDNHDEHPSYHSQPSVMFSRVMKAPCASGLGLCVALRLGLIIVSDWQTHQLLIYLLGDGSLVRRIGCRGMGKGQFNFDSGGLCLSPDGDSVLVAEYFNKRVQEVRVVDTDRPHFLRFIGEGVLKQPEYVDCNDKVIVVSEECHRINVFAWRTGCLLTQTGSKGACPGQLRYPRGLRLLPHNSGLVVADSWNDRLCVFGLNGEFVRAVGSKEQGLVYPHDVVEWSSSFIVANDWGRDLVRLSAVAVEARGVLAETLVPKFAQTAVLAALPDGGLVVREKNHINVFHCRALRVVWLFTCVMSE